MTAKTSRKSYSPFIGSLIATLCLAAYLSYSGQPGSDIRVWLFLSILSVVIQTLITGQRGFENHRIANPNDSDQTQEENYFYCGATFEDEDDPKDEVFNPVFSNELMAWRVAGLGLLLMSYFFCLKKLSGFQFHFADLAFLLGLTAIVYASTLRHFLFALGLVSWVVMVHQFSFIERVSDIPAYHWVWLGAYPFLAILTLQLHRLLDLEVRDPEANFLKRPGKKHALLIGSLALLVFGTSLVILSNWIIPQKQPLKVKPRQIVGGSMSLAFQQTPLSTGQNSASQNGVDEAADRVHEEPKKVTISQDEVMRLLQSLQNKPEEVPPSNAKVGVTVRADSITSAANEHANHNSPVSLELSLPSKLELEGLVRKDLESSAARSDQQVELSHETLASIHQAFEQQQAQLQQMQMSQNKLGKLNNVLAPATAASGPSQVLSISNPAPLPSIQNVREKLDLHSELEKVQAQVSSQLKAQSRENVKTDDVAKVSESAGLNEAAKSDAIQAKSQIVRQNEQKKDIGRLIELFRSAVFVLALFVIVSFVTKLLRKRAPPEEIHPSAVEMSDEDRARLKKEWKDLQKQKLSSREEVIACYQLFLKMMSSLGHTRPESLPPVEYAVSLELYFKPQIPSIDRVTWTFCDVFYGKDEPDSGHLKEFRAHFGSICRALL